MGRSTHCRRRDLQYSLCLIQYKQIEFSFLSFVNLNTEKRCSPLCAVNVYKQSWIIQQFLSDSKIRSIKNTSSQPVMRGDLSLCNPSTLLSFVSYLLCSFRITKLELSGINKSDNRTAFHQAAHSCQLWCYLKAKEPIIEIKSCDTVGDKNIEKTSK